MWVEEKAGRGGNLEGETMRRSTIAASILSAGIGFIFLFAQKTPAQGTELLVVVSDGMKPSVENSFADRALDRGASFATQFNSSKAIREKIQSGEPFDAAILTSDIIDDLIKQGRLRGHARRHARTGMGVGVRAGAPKPMSALRKR